MPARRLKRSSLVQHHRGSGRRVGVPARRVARRVERSEGGVDVLKVQDARVRQRAEPAAELGGRRPRRQVRDAERGHRPCGRRRWRGGGGGRRVRVVEEGGFAVGAATSTRAGRGSGRGRTCTSTSILWSLAVPLGDVVGQAELASTASAARARGRARARRRARCAAWPAACQLDVVGGHRAELDRRHLEQRRGDARVVRDEARGRRARAEARRAVGGGGAVGGGAVPRRRSCQSRACRSRIRFHGSSCRRIHVACTTNGVTRATSHSLSTECVSVFVNCAAGRTPATTVRRTARKPPRAVLTLWSRRFHRHAAAPPPAPLTGS